MRPFRSRAALVAELEAVNQGGLLPALEAAAAAHRPGYPLFDLQAGEGQRLQVLLQPEGFHVVPAPGTGTISGCESWLVRWQIR